MSYYYTLDEHGEPEPAEAVEWLAMMRHANHSVARTTIGRDVEVSTVFLGMSHGTINGLPLLFETLVFGGSLNDHGERYTTRKDALEGHERWVRRVSKPDEDGAA